MSKEIKEAGTLRFPPHACMFVRGAGGGGRGFAWKMVRESTGVFGERGVPLRRSTLVCFVMPKDEHNICRPLLVT